MGQGFEIRSLLTHLELGRSMDFLTYHAALTLNMFGFVTGTYSNSHNVQLQSIHNPKRGPRWCWLPTLSQAF